MGIDEMTGSPNSPSVPDPATFRVLPWAPEIGWILCDEYFNDGTPFPFSTAPAPAQGAAAARRARATPA